ncbi:MAG: bifunctional UDP-N-acetylglucosamine diphosphorylase/glucosamine-1-phosphate N-acetyltransferase GlmU [Rudaea sp.]|uniref:bifunctional UDP-N-acetylglucosamine diphosphorylase/glucosamine-1-phosphate N-acetyltransferase GlmU n=1 Tax=unclassified Rudaea TaxID=2627037 RepID=UPI0010F81E92|nr:MULTISPECIES: bifunctional UDP-N-acetylglucosamine diphosphorylase/glucosamine-1-phosphate N-acetyltransferase GlmU [unclassified Rudaea]MBN8887131.1 bifunctional UDP-N-acetylglucosamine diphosphorylase/glucosamine-1-phosphate N-acetyltransferase GlmU [Rudaea sp.]
MNMIPLHIVILAAGEGKRMKSAHAKVLLPLAGRPMLAHVLDTARALHPAKIHVVYGHRGEQVQAAFANQTDLAWVHQAEQKGTGHAMQLAIPGIPDAARVLVLYGDVPLIRTVTLQPLVEASAPLAVLAADLPDPQGYGRVLLDAAQRVTGIVEEKDATPAQRAVRTINTGVIAADAQRLRGWLARLDNHNVQGEFYLTDVFALAAADGEPALAVLSTDPNAIAGANDAWQLAQLERRYQLRAARNLCAQGVRLSDPARFDLRGSVSAGRDVEIDVDVVLEGTVALGDEVRIGAFCRIRNSTLAAGTVVQAHSDLDGVVTHGACVIGPYARLRAGAEIHAGAHVGNFVEVKNAIIGNDSKANHLSYIGDATIGAAVNIGAGTITCNYDGANKHRTVIEDGAFIGSNSALVAPVTIGKDATIGAGSTIGTNAPPGELTVARARQTTVRGWKRPQKAPK